MGGRARHRVETEIGHSDYQGKLDDDDLMHKARTAMESGATGLIFGRNMWQRPFDEALAITERVHGVMREFGA